MITRPDFSQPNKVDQNAVQYKGGVRLYLAKTSFCDDFFPVSGGIWQRSSDLMAFLFRRMSDFCIGME